MNIFKKAKDLTKYLESRKTISVHLGFVPTMGALHEGHLSLLKECKKLCELTVCSIFVNPTQFNNAADLKRYPKSVASDILLLEENGCDVLFLPDEKEIYPNAQSKSKHFDLGYLETILEGKFRPGHFQGVCLVIEKLLNIVNPDYLFLGQKDFQQCLVIKKLVKLMGKNVEVVICPILREKCGLAMSSRNLRLSPSERNLAASLHQALVNIKNNAHWANFLKLKKEQIEDLEGRGFKVEYLELAKQANLEVVSDFKSSEELVVLIAAFLGDVRLIDNLSINP